jgi:hypothetical protein
MCLILVKRLGVELDRADELGRRQGRGVICISKMWKLRLAAGS